MFFDYGNMMKNAIKEQGIDPAWLINNKEKIQSAHESVLHANGQGWYGWMELPYRNESEISEIAEYASQIRNQAESFVLFGIGGSGLGPLAVATSLLHLRHNELPKNKRNAPRLYIEDNVDPQRMNSLLDIIDLNQTHFNFVTKSGETSETLSQFLIVYKLLKDSLGEEAAKKRVTVTTTVGKGSLFEIANREGLKVFDIEAGVGGRFSVFSNVGLFPFAVMGFDIRQMLSGARLMSEACLNKDIAKNPALMSASLHIASMEKAKNICVMMPYADSLRFVADFFSQLWGESLGKQKDNDGKIVRYGQTPVKALGATDQHSQLQLYVEGPHDKIVTFIAVENYPDDIMIPKNSEMDKVAFLMGNTMSKLIKSECTATAFALTKAGCPNYTITLPNINENTIGQLLMYFMFQTAFAGVLLNIDAFNQPGVEEGKKATFAILGRKGYEKKLEELQKQRENKFVITI